jgi:PhoH-like ATPase
MIKIYVLDTNVLLHDPKAIFKFEDNHVVIPIVVVEELDNFKKSQDMLGQNARRVSNSIDALKTSGSLQDGVRLEGGGTLRVAFNGHASLIPPMLQGEKADTHILGCALANQKTETALAAKEKREAMPVVMVSKDTNLRIKAEALGIRAQDYENDRIPDVSSLYSEARSFEMPLEMFTALAGSEETDAEAVKEFGLEVNECFVARCGTSSILARHSASSGMIVNLSKKGDKEIHGILPKNKEQRFALEMLMDPGISLVTLAGMAGTGKTLLALAAGLNQVMEDGRYSRIMVSRPVFPMGKDLGFLPGDIAEKINPWMQPIFDNIACLYGAYKTGKRGKMKGDRIEGERMKAPVRPHEELMAYGILEVEPLTYIRGRSIPNQFIVVDEAQNLTPHEVKTILTRAGEGSKIVLTGDPFQIDNPFVDAASNGLSHVANRFRGQPEAGHVTLIRGERSRLAEKAAKLL